MSHPYRMIALACITAAGALTAPLHADRTLVHEAIIDAPVDTVWSMFTTTEGASQWMVAKVDIDLRVGGSMRTSYNPQSTLDDEFTIVNRILAYEPMHMIATRNVQAPAGFEWIEQFQQTWSVTYFESLGPNRTGLRIVGLGYGEGPQWDRLYTFFEAGNQQVLDQLKRQFEPAADDTDAILELLGTLVGGEWRGEVELPDGNILRSRGVYRHGPDGQSIVARGWLGVGEQTSDHGSSLIHRLPASDGGGVAFVNIDENGAVSRGRLTLDGDNTIIWNWRLTALDGRTQDYRVTMRFDNDNRYTFTLEQREGESWMQRVEMPFVRRE
jgi:uncharacterized protein YndB with AHSA1/START domain